MTTLDDFRRLALAMPGTTEGTHFRMPAFAVRGKNFASIDKEGRAMLSLGADEVAAAVGAGIEPVLRSGKPIGIRVDLGQVTTERLAELVELAWQHRSR
ncbi:MmcQ/YjbR family DNA-binding protein [Saccharopolyspora hirsuta]|uniref:MmcQ/YjbR family DNA-binding protein n=1 Tax=Saccharopolyspora hirsuta TaxID=1837 RepID=A0A5M7C8V7_SACHI|nr:MmcQ/YjbR family DNA-binding protein [Saccharopolyspora hirsuta]KAA5838173.1 MmcQ/YjbR family DNA-binding protein [Saccharopolyspora hirsuta]